MENLYVVTRSINEYNQDGEYFVGVFKLKPDKDDILNMLPCLSDEQVENLVKRGGGRLESEYE